MRFRRMPVAATALLAVALLIGASGVLHAGPVPASTAAPPLRLVGQSEGEVRRLLGRPNRVENNGPHKLLHYQLGDCTVLLDLFVDVSTRRYDVLSQRIEGDRQRCAHFARH